MEMRSSKDESLFRKVVERKPGLTTLPVKQPAQAERDDSIEDDNESDNEFHRESLRRTPFWKGYFVTVTIV